MNLTKALKHKKKLIKKADEYYMRFAKFNSVEKSSTLTYDPKDMYDKWRETTSELVDLKSKIQKANVPILNKIFMLSELKNTVHKLKSVSTLSGTVTHKYSSEFTEYICFMDEKDKDDKIQLLEEQIESIQEEIETFNAITKI